jgi:hypothetical protein
MEQNNKLLVQQYLETRSFGDLAREHGIYVSFAKAGYFWSMNYDQIEAKDDDLIVQECRGLILATKDGRSLTSQAKMVNDRLCYDDICPGETVVLAMGFRRFYNFGQGAAAQIDWSDPNLKVQNKEDGTLILLWANPFENYRWVVSTRSVPEADIPLDSWKEMTFRTLFEKAVKDTSGNTFEEITSYLDKNYTWVFELTSPFNQIVIRNNDCRVVFLAARNLNTLQEVSIDNHYIQSEMEVVNIPTVKTYSLSNIDKVIEFVNAQNPLEQGGEGVVVLDGKFNRIKVKNANYVVLNKMRDSLGASTRNCLELILHEKDDDVVGAMPPEIAETVQDLKKRYVAWLKKMEAEYREIWSLISAEGSKNKKDFALEIQRRNVSFPAPFYSTYDKKCEGVKDFIVKAKREGTWSNSFLDKILSEIKA